MPKMKMTFLVCVIVLTFSPILFVSASADNANDDNIYVEKDTFVTDDLSPFYPNPGLMNRIYAGNWAEDYYRLLTFDVSNLKENWISIELKLYIYNSPWEGGKNNLSIWDCPSEWDEIAYSWENFTQDNYYSIENRTPLYSIPTIQSLSYKYNISTFIQTLESSRFSFVIGENLTESGGTYSFHSRHGDQEFKYPRLYVIYPDTFWMRTWKWWVNGVVGIGIIGFIVWWIIDSRRKK